MKTALNLQPFTFNQLPDPYMVRKGNHTSLGGPLPPEMPSAEGLGVTSNYISGDLPEKLPVHDPSAEADRGRRRGRRGRGKKEEAGNEAERASSSSGQPLPGGRAREGDDWTRATDLCAICTCPLPPPLGPLEPGFGGGQVSAAATASKGYTEGRAASKTMFERGCCVSCRTQILAPMRAHVGATSSGDSTVDQRILSMLPEIVGVRLGKYQ